MRFLSRDPEATRAAARALARAVDGRGLVVALVGPLGAGKTLFARGLAEGLGLDGAGVASPTFTLLHEYPVAPPAAHGEGGDREDGEGRGPEGEKGRTGRGEREGMAGIRRFVHADLYRLETPGELEDAGFLDALEPGVLVAVEWADRFPEALPADRLEVRLTRGGAAAPGPHEREIELRGLGPVAREVLARFAAARRAGPRAGAGDDGRGDGAEGEGRSGDATWG